MKRLTLTLVAATLAVACDRQPATSDTAADNAAAASATPGATAAAAPQTTSAADFVAKAAATDAYEIAAAKLVLGHNPSDAIKRFAQMMVHDHTDSTAKLKAAIAKSGQSLALPQALPPDLQANLDALKGAAAGQLDGLYVGQMVDTHRQAETVMTAYAANGDVASLKSFAAAVAPIVRRHLEAAQALQAKG